MLGAAKSNAHGTELARASRIFWRVGIGAHRHFSVFVRPFHHFEEVARDLLRNRRLHRANHDLARGAVDTEHILAPKCPTLHRDLTILCVDRQLARANDAALAPTNSDHCSMTRLAASRSKNAHRAVHAINILRTRLLTNEQHLLTILRALDGFLGGKREFACRGTWACTQSTRDRRCTLLVLR